MGASNDIETIILQENQEPLECSSPKRDPGDRSITKEALETGLLKGFKYGSPLGSKTSSLETLSSCSCSEYLDSLEQTHTRLIVLYLKLLTYTVNKNGANYHIKKNLKSFLELI